MKFGYKITMLLKLFVLFISTDLASSFVLQYPSIRSSRISRIPGLQLTSALNIADADTVTYTGGASSIGGLSMIGLGGVPGHGGLLGGHLGLQPQSLGLRSPFGLRGVAASPMFLTSDLPDGPSFDSPDFVVARSGSLSDLAQANYLRSITDADNIVVG